uniref:Uncharacterized protein n=1 Tax=Globodera rostochiensis TaxID=31243 RepID=A0A914GPP2_GLORO
MTSQKIVAPVQLKITNSKDGKMPSSVKVYARSTTTTTFSDEKWADFIVMCAPWGVMGSDDEFIHYILIPFAHEARRREAKSGPRGVCPLADRVTTTLWAALQGGHMDGDEN